MKRIHLVFHDGGGGHRNAAVALQTVITQQERHWQVGLVQFQDLTDRLDILRKLTGIRIQRQYNILLQNGWTFGSTSLPSAASDHPPIPQAISASPRRIL